MLTMWGKKRNPVHEIHGLHEHCRVARLPQEQIKANHGFLSHQPSLISKNNTSILLIQRKASSIPNLLRLHQRDNEEYNFLRKRRSSMNAQEEKPADKTIRIFINQHLRALAIGEEESRKRNKKNKNRFKLWTNLSRNFLSDSNAKDSVRIGK